MQPINPGLFARLMKLPEQARTDILEFLGATPIADSQLCLMLDTLSTKFNVKSRPSGLDVG